MTPSFCRHCGRPLTEGARFCAGCGNAVAPVRPESAVTAPAPPPQPAPTATPHGPQDPQDPDRPRRATSRLLAIGACLVLVMIAAGAGTAYLMTREADAGPGGTERAGRSGDLTVDAAGFGQGLDLLGEPGSTWTLRADDVVPGGSFVGGTFDEGTAVRPLVLGDLAVLGIYEEDGGTGLVAVDTTTGEVAWRREDIHSTLCAVVPDDALVCAESDDAGERSTVTVLGADGKTRAETEYDATMLVAADAEAAYLVHNDDLPSVTKVRADDLSEVWHEQLGPPQDSGSHGISVSLVGDRLLFYFGVSSWLVDTDDGIQLATGGWDVRPRTDDYVVHTGDEDHTVVTAGDDIPVLDAPGAPWFDPEPEPGLIGIGDTAFDLGDGTATWSRPDLPEDPSLAWTLDHEQVLVDSFAADGTLVLDADTGETEWEAEETIASYSAAFDAGAFLQATDDALIARDRHTGDLAWEVSYDTAATSPTVSVTDTATVVAADAWLTGVTDFPAAAGEEGGDGGTSYTTACGSPPEFVPTAAEAAYGGVSVTYEVRATCPGGQWLNHSQLSVPFVVDGSTYAAGYFDYSDAPVWVPDEGVDLQLVYPFDGTIVPLQDIQGAIEEDGGTGDVVEVPCEPGPSDVPGSVPSDPDFGGDPDAPSTSVGAPDDGDAEETALAALQRIAAEDAPAIEALDGRWTPQLSSKEKGTVWDGLVYDYADILALHLRLKARYPEVLLAFSSDWRSFKLPGYWVTVEGTPYAGARAALDWCVGEGWSADNCYAKRIRRDGDWETDTDQWPPGH